MNRGYAEVRVRHELVRVVRVCVCSSYHRSNFEYFAWGLIVCLSVCITIL